MSFETPQPPYNASDPHATFLSSSCFEFLLIEVVPLAYRTAAAVAKPGLPIIAGAGAGRATKAANGSISGSNAVSVQGQGHERKGSSAIGGSGVGGTAGAKGDTDVLGPGPGSKIGTVTEEDAQREVVSKRLEALGYRVGQGIVERFSRDRPRFSDALDVIKFLCKDLWTLLFRKQIDNLKTNHRGVYVLTDNTFKPFSRMSMKTSAEALERAQPFLWFPCGIIRGALASLGIQAVVQAESMELPAAVFQIKTIAAKA